MKWLWECNCPPVLSDVGTQEYFTSLVGIRGSLLRWNRLTHAGEIRTTSLPLSQIWWEKRATAREKGAARTKPFSYICKPLAGCVWKSSAHLNPPESRLRGCRMRSTTWRNSPWGIDYWTSCLRRAKVTAEVPRHTMAVLFERGPGFVHIDSTPHKSQWHLQWLEPTAASPICSHNNLIPAPCVLLLAL